MATAILRSHDCLKNRLPASMGLYAQSQPDSGQVPGNRSIGFRKRSSQSGFRQNHGRTTRRPAKDLPAGPVTILKRGQEYKPGAMVNTSGAVGSDVAEVRVSKGSQYVLEKRALKEGETVRKVSSVNGGFAPVSEVNLSKKGREAAERGFPISEVNISKKGREPAERGFSKMDVVSDERLGPDPALVPKQLGFSGSTIVEKFAGPVCFSSPSPSSLPMPGFSRKKQMPTDCATKDLRRLLGINL
ncbi:hypothetical protein AMTRI_Chr12g237060 [Amborella trichopoda]